MYKKYILKGKEWQRLSAWEDKDLVDNYHSIELYDDDLQWYGTGYFRSRL